MQNNKIVTHGRKNSNRSTGLILAFGSSMLGIETPLSILLTGRWPSCKGYVHTDGQTVKKLDISHSWKSIKT